LRSAPAENERARSVGGHARDGVHDLAQQRHVHRVRRRAVDAQHHHAVVVLVDAHVLHRSPAYSTAARAPSRSETPTVAQLDSDRRTTRRWIAVTQGDGGRRAAR
jgi:hypothetical protein